MKFTHSLNIKWNYTEQTASDFKEVKHLGKCAFDGDMFVAYHENGEIHIFKGTMEEETLKTNTWYKGNLGLFVYRTGDTGNYGFNSEKESDNCFCKNPKVWTEATDKEVEDALIKLAKKKGFKNINELRLKDPYGNVFEKRAFTFQDNSFKLICGNTLLLDGVIIFNKGKWAEILEDEPLSIEERLKNLEDKIL